MRRPDNSLTARIEFVCGSTGSGKSTWIKRRINGQRRVLVWDSKDEYGELPGFERITSAKQLAAALQRRKTGRYAFAAPLSMFPFWCSAVYAWGHCIAVAEELADVTTPSKATGKWGEIIRKGRGYGIHLIAASQRPAEVDKTVIGNATRIHCGRLTRGADREYMARELDIPREKIDNLRPLEWVERCMNTGEIFSGKITFPG